MSDDATEAIFASVRSRGGARFAQILQDTGIKSNNLSTRLRRLVAAGWLARPAHGFYTFPGQEVDLSRLPGDRHQEQSAVAKAVNRQRWEAMTAEQRREATADWQGAGVRARKERWERLTPEERAAEVAAIADARWPGRTDGETGQEEQK